MKVVEGEGRVGVVEGVERNLDLESACGGGEAGEGEGGGEERGRAVEREGVGNAGVDAAEEVGGVGLGGFVEAEFSDEGFDGECGVAEDGDVLGKCSEIRGRDERGSAGARAGADGVDGLRALLRDEEVGERVFDGVVEEGPVVERGGGSGRG